MDRVGLRRFWDATKAFLFARRSREAFVFAFFVLISALFWLIQTLNGTFDMELRFPLQLTGVPEDVVVTSEMPTSLDVGIRDKGTSLLRYVTRSVVRPVEVAFEAHDEGSTFGHVLVTHTELLPQVADVLLGSTRVTSIQPDTIEYFYSRGSSKRVCVVPRGVVDTDPLYYLVGVSCKPDSATIWGPQEILDTLACIPTVATNMNDLRSTTTRNVRLAVPRGLKIDPAEVELSAEVDMFTEKHVDVHIQGTNFPAGHTLRTFPSFARVSFRVGAKDYKRIVAENFVITATYEDLISLPPNSKLKLHLRSLPDGVSQVRISPEEVDFLIESITEE